MDLNWSLKELYPSFQCQEFKDDFETLDIIMKEYVLLGKETAEVAVDTREILERYIYINQNLSRISRMLSAMTSLTLSTDTKNVTALRYQDILISKLSNLAENEAKITKWIGSIENLDVIIESSPLLKEHKFILKEEAEKAKYILSDKEEGIIAKMRTTGSTAWEKLKNILTSSLMVDIELNNIKQQLPLSVVRNLAYEADPTIRKTAYEAELTSYEKINDGMAAALNGIKGEVITISKLRGFDSPLDETLANSRMDKATLNAMLQAMEEYMPYFRAYLKKKAELLGHNNGLPFYDLFAPMGNVDMSYTYEEGCKCVIDNFRTFSDDLAEFAKNAIENSWIDVKPKQGKVGGAFCSGIHPLGQCRILLNYGDTFSDVVTLAHELGHGYHGHCLREESILNSGYPMPIAETASTFCETIVKKAALKTATSEEKLAILEGEIGDCTQVIVDIYSRYLFEMELFKRREEASLSVDEINEIMLHAQKKAYGDGLDPNFLHPYMWACKTHYYYASRNFYNFPYAFGQLFSKGLYAEYLKRGESFAEDYKKLLSVTGKNNLKDIAMIMNIDITDINFWRSSLEIIKIDIEEFLSLK